MKDGLTEYFAAQAQGRTKRAAIRRLLEFPCRTQIGRRLLHMFYETGGTITYRTRSECEHSDRYRAAYFSDRHEIFLNARSTPESVVHELAHGRQFLKLSEIFKRWNYDLLSNIHITLLLEADCHALGAIYMKQFFANHLDQPDLLSLFFKRERRAFSIYERIAPVELDDGEKTSWIYLMLKSAENYLYETRFSTPPLSERIPAMEDLLKDIKNPQTHGSWAEIIYRSYIDQCNAQGSLPSGYATRVTCDYLSSYKYINEKNPHIKQKSLKPDEFRKMILKLSNIEDIGIKQSYIQSKSPEDMLWCTEILGCSQATINLLAKVLEITMKEKGLSLSPS